MVRVASVQDSIESGLFIRVCKLISKSSSHSSQGGMQGSAALVEGGTGRVVEDGKCEVDGLFDLKVSVMEGGTAGRGVPGGKKEVDDTSTRGVDKVVVDRGDASSSKLGHFVIAALRRRDRPDGDASKNGGASSDAEEAVITERCLVCMLPT